MSGVAILLLLILVVVLNARQRARIVREGAGVADWIARGIVLAFGAFMLVGAILNATA